MDIAERITNGLGDLISLAIDIYIIVVFFRMAKEINQLKEQQNRIEHNIYLITQQQARIEKEIKRD